MSEDHTIIGVGLRSLAASVLFVMPLLACGKEAKKPVVTDPQAITQCLDQAGAEVLRGDSAGSRAMIDALLPRNRVTVVVERSQRDADKRFRNVEKEALRRKGPVVIRFVRTPPTRDEARIVKDCTGVDV